MMNTIVLSEAVAWLFLLTSEASQIVSLFKIMSERYILVE